MGTTDRELTTTETGLALGSNRTIPNWRSELLPVTAILLLGLAVRLAALAHWGVGPIDGEGACYARIAENLRKGLGYVGIENPGTEIVFPPLFPLLIAAVSFVTGSYVWAARGISLVLGTLLPLPVFGIAKPLFGRRVAYTAALLTALYPLLVNLSLTAFSEGPYATILFFGIYAAICALIRPTVKMWCVTGAIFGAACLLRPEAMAAFLATVVLALATEETWSTRWKHTAAAMVVFSLVVFPEVVFLYHATGRVRLEAKSAVVLPMSVETLDRGLSEQADRTVTFGIDSNLRGTGIYMRPQAEIAADSAVRSKDVARLVAYVAPRNVHDLLDRLSARWFGAPFLPALALVGVLKRPWRRRTIAGRLLLMLIPSTAILATFSTINDQDRYSFILIPFLLIWAANGLVEVGHWVGALTRSSPGISRTLQRALPGIVGAIMIVYPIKGVRHLYEFQSESPANRAILDTGQWISRQQSGPIKLMSSSASLAFHADGELVWVPYCSSGDLALRYLEASGVDYVVLRRGQKWTDWYDDWVKNGIPDPRAKLVYVSSSGQPGNELLVFRWNHAASHGPAANTVGN